MAGFLKIFGKGILYTLISPFIVVVWALYSVYLVFVFIFELFKNLILFFTGRDSSTDLPEDIEARRIVLEAEKSIQDTQIAVEAALQSQSVPQQPVFQQEAPVNVENNITPEPSQEVPQPSSSWDNPYNQTEANEENKEEIKND